MVKVCVAAWLGLAMGWLGFGWAAAAGQAQTAAMHTFGGHAAPTNSIEFR